MDIKEAIVIFVNTEIKSIKKDGFLLLILLKHWVILILQEMPHKS
jgi:hypothetical protein